MIHRNYYTCGFNANSSQCIRTDISDKWSINFDTKVIEKRPLKTFREEVLHSCELIYEEFGKYTPKLNLYFSGGMDSECMLRSFVELGIPVNPIVITHYYSPFADETLNAMRVCNELSVKPLIFDLNLRELYSNKKLYELGIKYQSPRLGMLELLHVMEQISEPSVLADDIQMLHISSDKNLLNINETDFLEWMYEIREDEDGVFYRYECITGIPTISDFFRYTPQSWASMILTEDIKDIIFNYRGKASATSTKNTMMAREFNVLWRQKTGVFFSPQHWEIRNRIKHDLENELYPFSTALITYEKLLQLLGYHYALQNTNTK